MLKPFNQGGTGAFQLIGRIDYLDLDSGRLKNGVTNNFATGVTSLAAANTRLGRGGKQTGYLGGLTWIPTDYVRFLLNYIHTEVQGGPLAATTVPISGKAVDKRSRIERLTARGEIAGFTVLTRSDVAQAPVRGLMLIGIEGKGAERIMARLSGIPAVVAVHSTNGKWDLVAELATQTLPDLDAVIFRIRSIEGVMTSETNLLLSTSKAGRRPG